MDLDRTEVSDTSESTLHCTICSTCRSCPVEPALSFAILVLSSILLLCTTVYHCLLLYITYIIMYLVLRMVLHMVVIQCLDSFPFQFCSVTSCHDRCRWCCGSYQLWSTCSQICMHPVCHPDGLFVSTGHGTPSAVPTHACTPVVLSPSLVIPWTCGTCVGSTGPFS